MRNLSAEIDPMKSIELLTLMFAAAVTILPSAAFSAAPSTEMRAVDLRSFLHGEPPAPPKAAPLKQLAIVSTAAGVMPDTQIESFMRAFADAIKARDGKPMLSRLSAKYVIDDLPAGRNAGDLFSQAIDRIPGAVEIIIKSVERKNDIRTAMIEFRYSVDNVKEMSFRFDAAGKLLWSDLFALQRQQHGT